MLETVKKASKGWTEVSDTAGDDTVRAAKTITRSELVKKMLNDLDEKLATGQWTADEIIKVASAIEKLDKQTNIVTITEVFTAFNQWLVSRMQVDPGLTPEIVKIINTYQDKFISEKLGSITIPIE